jgi:hypothetical protein
VDSSALIYKRYNVEKTTPTDVETNYLQENDKLFEK